MTAGRMSLTAFRVAALSGVALSELKQRIMKEYARAQPQSYAELADHFAFHHPSQVARYGAAMTRGCQECERE